MKRVLSLVLALVMVLGMIPTFAAEMTGGEHLLEHGFITGKPGDDVATKLDAGAALTRQELAALIAELMGEKEIAAVFAQPADYADADMIGSWAVPFVAYAQVNGWMNGKSGNMFDPLGQVPGQQLAAVLMNALGYTVDTEAKYATVIADASALGLTVPSGNLTRGEAFESMWTAVSEINVNGEEMTLGVKLGKLDPPAPVVTELAVKGVVADNARQVKVEFNQPVDEDTIVAANLKVYVGTSTTATTWTAHVDGAMVTLGLTADVPQDTDVKVVVKDVVAANDEEAVKMPEATITARMKDVTSPSILNVVATTSKTFTFNTSEPLQVGAGEVNFHVLQNITVDGVKLVGKISVDYAKNTYTVELGSKLAVGEHTIAVTGLKDIVGFAANTFNGTITIVEDITAPSVVGVTYVDRSTVKVMFNEPVNVAGTFTIDGYATTVGAANSTKTEYTVTIDAPNVLGLASIIKATLSYSGTTDMEGNVVTTAKTFDFTSTDDLVVPTATVSITSANKIKVVFSETMSDPGVVTVKNASGATVAVGNLVLDSTDTTNKTYVSQNATGTSAATYTVELKNSKDNGVRLNTIVTTTTSVTSFDIASPTISNVITVNAYNGGTTPVTNGKAKIYFSEAMDVASITNLTNYIVDLDGAGVVHSTVQLSSITGAAAVAAADGKSVVLTIPGADYLAGTTQIFVLAVKDAAGNLIATGDFNAAKTVAVAAPATSITATEVIAVNKVKVTLDQAVSAVDPSNFKINNNADALAYVGVAYELSADSKEVTITFNGNLTTDAKVLAADGGIAKLEIVSGNTKDVFGVAISQASTNLVDKVAPTIAVASGANTGEIKVTFSESIDATDITTLMNDVIVRNALGVIVDYTAMITYTGGGAAVTDFTTMTLQVGAGETGKVYSVEVIKRDVLVDQAGNSVPALAKTNVTVK